MFKLGSYLLFITFSQLIAVLLYAGSIENVNPLVGIVILIELIYAGYLVYLGYLKQEKVE